MIQSNQQVYDNIIAFLSEEESATIKSKVKYYLKHYVKENTISNFKVCLSPYATVDRIILYTNEDKTTYRQMKFIPDGDLFSVMHYEETNGIVHCVYGLGSKSISRINQSK